MAVQTTPGGNLYENSDAGVNAAFTSQVALNRDAKDAEIRGYAAGLAAEKINQTQLDAALATKASTTSVTDLTNRVTAVETGKRNIAPTELSTEHLDTILTPGVYSQSSNLEATLETGYPITRGGLLTVEKSAANTMVWQVYKPYVPSTNYKQQEFKRSRYNGVWTGWDEVGSGGGIQLVSGTVALDATGDPVREFYTTAATTFTSNGNSTLISSMTAVVWRRDGGGVWAYRTVDSWTAVVPPESVPPTVGTLASSAITQTGFTLTVTGAADETALHAQPYAFSIDGGTTWSQWQSSNVYVASGLASSTTYLGLHRVRDAAGNTATGSGVSVTTKAVVVSYQQAVLADAPTLYLPLDDAAGTTNPRNLGTSSAATTLVRGSVTFGAAGLGDGGTSATFAGSSADDIAVDQITGLSNITAGTVEALIYPTVMDVARYIWDGSAYAFNLNSNSNIQAWGVQAGALNNFWKVNTAYHLAATWDGTTVRFYRNGTQIQTAAKSSLPGTRLGILPLGKSFQGRLAGVTYYTTALSPARILAHAQAAGYAA